MDQLRQTFKNTTNDEIFITLEPWCWRYRLKPEDVLEITYSVECRQENWAPLDIQVGMEGDKTGLFIWINGNREPDVLLNGSTAIVDYNVR